MSQYTVLMDTWQPFRVFFMKMVYYNYPAVMPMLKLFTAIIVSSLIVQVFASRHTFREPKELAIRAFYFFSTLFYILISGFSLFPKQILL